MEFTGEFFVPDQAPARLADDHLARYRFTSGAVSGQTVLDIACGAGYGTAMLADAGALHVDGVDLSPAAIAFANERYGQRTNVTYHPGDVCTFGHEQQYDTITCFETIEHVPDYAGALRNLRRLLAPSGVLYISSPNRPVTSPSARTLADRPMNRFHTQEFTVTELRKALHDAGFAVDDTAYGQRLQPLVRWRLANRAYRRAFRPETRKSPAVTPLGSSRSSVPRYFILLARVPTG